MTTRTGHCFLCGSPSNPNGIGGELERCDECKRKNAQARRQRWSMKNTRREAEMKAAWSESNRERKRATSEVWRKANLARFNETGKAWKRRNPGAMKAYRLRKYGLTIEQYEAMVVAQDSRCAICGTTTPAKHGSWCVDHDHETKEVRGLLCVKCNAEIGHFDDDPGLLLAAERYLQKHRTRRLRVA